MVVAFNWSLPVMLFWMFILRLLEVELNRVVRKLQFQNNFLIKNAFLQGFSPKKCKTVRGNQRGSRTSPLNDCKVDIFSVESKEIPCIDNYDALIIGTPTYHAAPAKIILKYFDSITPLTKRIHAFIYNTKGLYSLNTNRILAKALLRKNIFTIMDNAYRSPASDGSVIAPFIKRFFEFDRNIEQKINRDCAAFMELLNRQNLKFYITRFQLDSIINAPNKAAGHFFTRKIYLHKDSCSRYGKCIKRCPHSAFSVNTNGYPIIDSKNCENCYRYVHNCPNLALSLRKKIKLKKTLAYSLAQ